MWNRGLEHGTVLSVIGETQVYCNLGDFFVNMMGSYCQATVVFEYESKVGKIVITLSHLFMTVTQTKEELVQSLRYKYEEIISMME